MTKNILNWAETEKILDNRTPIVQMSYIMTELGRLAHAVNINDPESVSQCIAETHINMVILSELCSINFDEAVEKGFNKGEVQINDVQELAALRGVNVRSQKLLIQQSNEIKKLKKAIDHYEKRTIYYEPDSKEPVTN